MTDTRIKILSVIILSVAFSLSKTLHIYGVIIITLLYAFLFRKYLVKSIQIVGYTLVFILAIGVMSWLFASDVSITDMLLNSVRWISLVLVTFLIFSSINLFELISSLAYLKLNTKIAIALGVGLRFLPLLVEEAKNILRIQRRDNTLKNKNIFYRVNCFLSPFLISTIRRVDSITLSLTTQQIEERIKHYKFNRISLTDCVLIVICVLFFVYIVL
jgi:energy-coupling factor transporter transmembrane protein EcfT